MRTENVRENKGCDCASNGDIIVALFVFSTKAARITNMSVIMEPPALGAMRVSFVEDKTWKCIP